MLGALSVALVISGKKLIGAGAHAVRNDLAEKMPPLRARFQGQVSGRGTSYWATKPVRAFGGSA